MNDHFRQRYFEILAAARLPCSKPKMMNYSNIAMVWAEIVLQKDVDWRTVYGRNVNRLNRGLWMIPINWMGPSDCWPWWSNRMSNNSGYGAHAISGLHKHLSNSEEYNPYQTVGNDPAQTFSICMKGEAMGMTTIHIIALETILPQHSVSCMEAESMAMSTVHTTLWRIALTHHLAWRMKGKVMAMTMDRIIQLLTSFFPHSILRLNSRPTIVTTIYIIMLQTFLLRLSGHMCPLAIGRRKSSSDNLRKRPDKAKLIIRKSLRKITTSIICIGIRFISSILVHHMVWAGPAADLMRRTLTRTQSDSWWSLQRQYKACSDTDIGIP
jgi:hypothetical protein